MNNGAVAGVGCANSNNGVSNTRWNIGGRASGSLNSYVTLTAFERRRLSRAQPSEIGYKPTPLGSFGEERYLSRRNGLIGSMKTYCKSVDVTSDEHLYFAYGEFSHGRQGKRKFEDFFARPIDDVVAEARAMINCRDLSGMRPIAYFHRHEPVSGKDRIIGSECAMHQYLDYIAVTALMDLFNAKIGYHQCASIKGKGQRHAVKYLKRWVRSGKSKVYVKLDIRKYYNSIDRTVVMDMLRRDVRNCDLLWLVEELISMHDVGLNIGSYLSQYLANYYLSGAYRLLHDAKKERKSKRTGEVTDIKLIDHAITYMDDWVIIGHDKRDLKMAVRRLARYLRDVLHVEIKPWKVCHIDVEPIDMVGYVFRRTWTAVRSGIFLRARRAFRSAKHALILTPHIAARCIAYWGYIKTACTRHYRKRNGIKRILADCKDVMSLAQIERNWYAENPQCRAA